MQMSEWQPIETAPKDGTYILCVCMRTMEGSEKHLGHMEVDNWKDRYHGFGKFNTNAWPATHWMSLPSPPSKEKQAEETR
jgi:hypothetical protein